MNKEFIPHEQILELKQLGFHGILWQEAFRWFREKYNLDEFVQHHVDGSNETYFSMARESTWDVTSHETYEEAELACLKKLIEIVKNKI